MAIDRIGYAYLSADARIDSSATTFSYGSHGSTYVGRSSTRYIKDLQNWDLSTIPTDAVISAFYVQYFDDNWSSRTANSELSLYQLSAANEDWAESPTTDSTGTNYSTWSHKIYSSSAWAGSAGCSTATTDYITTALATGTFYDGTAGWKYLTGTSYGLTTINSLIGSTMYCILYTDATDGDWIQLRSRNTHGLLNSPQSLRPRLKYIYTIPDGKWSRNPSFKNEVHKQRFWQGVKYDDASINDDGTAWIEIVKQLDEYSLSGKITSQNPIVATYALAYSTGAVAKYIGSVLAIHDYIYHVPYSATVGQVVNPDGVTTTTFALPYTIAGAYTGAGLLPSGDIHFTNYYAAVGTKFNRHHVGSTYSLIYTSTGGAYIGGCLDSTGAFHMSPSYAPVGQKIGPEGIVATYSLVYTSALNKHRGAILAPNGDVHFITQSGAVGQKVSSGGVVSTYSLVNTGTNYYISGAMNSNGIFHMAPFEASVGQQIDLNTGTVSTYPLVYTASQAYRSGVRGNDDYIYFVPSTATVGQRVSPTGVVSTFSLPYTTTSAYDSGTLHTDGAIHFAPLLATVGMKIFTTMGKTATRSHCLSGFSNRY